MLTEHQKNMVSQSYYGKDYEDLNKEQVEVIDSLSNEEAWHHFLEVESDPDEVYSMYCACFDPELRHKYDVFDSLWEIFLIQNPSDYATILAVTGRVEELAKYLKEYAHGLSEGKA